MSQKLMPRLGSAIASTILSVFWAVSLVGVDKAQAAVLTYNFDADSYASGFFNVDNSSLTGIEVEEIAVSQGDYTVGSLLPLIKDNPKNTTIWQGLQLIFIKGIFADCEHMARTN